MLYSISLQLGRPWMLHVDDLVRTAGTWYKDNLATNWGDAILSAFVELRTIGSEMLEIMSDEDSCNHRQSEISLSMFSSELDLWDKKWDNFFRGRKIIQGLCSVRKLTVSQLKILTHHNSFCSDSIEVI